MALFFTRIRRFFLSAVATLMAELNKLAFATAPVFYQLVYMAFSAGCILAMITVIRRFFDKRISPRWKMAMWALVLAALIIPWRPVSRVSVMKNAQPLQNISYRDEYDRADMELHKMIASSQLVEEARFRRAVEREEKLFAKSRIFDVFLPLLWLGGTVAGGLWRVVSAYRLKGKIRSHTINNGDKYTHTVTDCMNLLKLKHRPAVAVQSFVNSPAVTGILRPVVLLPEYAADCDEQTIKYILLHELAHIKRGDMLLNGLLIVLHIVYWPVAWLYLAGIRRDMELANDAAVIKLLDENRQKEYSRSLVWVLANISAGNQPGRIMYMADSKNNIARRIEMIKQSEFFARHRRLLAILCSVAVVAMAAMFLTDSPANVENSEADCTDSAHQYYHPLPEDGSMVTHDFICELPQSEKYTGDISSKIARLAVQLPAGVSVGPAPVENRAPIGDFDCIFYMYKRPENPENLYQWYVMDNLVCYVGFNTYRPYTDEISDEEYYKTVWSSLRLMSVANWDPFTSVKNDGNVESGTVQIWSKDPAEIDNYPGQMPDVPVMETNGVLAYSRRMEVYIGIAFMPGQVTDRQAEYIAGTVEIFEGELPQE